MIKGDESPDNLTTPPKSNAPETHRKKPKPPPKIANKTEKSQKRPKRGRRIIAFFAALNYDCWWPVWYSDLDLIVVASIWFLLPKSGHNYG